MQRKFVMQPVLASAQNPEGKKRINFSKVCKLIDKVIADNGGQLWEDLGECNIYRFDVTMKPIVLAEAVSDNIRQAGWKTEFIKGQKYVDTVTSKFDISDPVGEWYDPNVSISISRDRENSEKGKTFLAVCITCNE